MSSMVKAATVSGAVLQRRPFQLRWEDQLLHRDIPTLAGSVLRQASSPPRPAGPIRPARTGGHRIGQQIDRARTLPARRSTIDARRTSAPKTSAPMF
jgi:hypothetical protein